VLKEEEAAESEEHIVDPEIEKLDGQWCLDEEVDPSIKMRVIIWLRNNLRLHDNPLFNFAV
jgi:hypothetical protein